MSSCVIGVDLGGTNVRAGAFYEDGSEAGPSYSNPSKAQEGTPAILASIAATIQQAVATAAVKPTEVGLAIPGHVDDERGMIVWAPNFGENVNGVFKYWENVEVRDPLAKMTGLNIRMGNDANLAALGEYKFGTGRNSAKCLVMLTIGTGIGGGVVMAPISVQGDARGPLVLLGGNKGGAELGHTVVNYQGPECNSGEFGSLESYCQRDAIVRRAQHRIRRGRKTILNDMVGEDLSKLTPKHISQAAEQGDEVSLEVWEEVGTMLGVGIGNFIAIFAPDIVAIGGQIAKAGDLLLKPAIRTARNVAVPSLFSDAKIVVAEQIEDAGMLGGAALALEPRT
ncbi:ROK family protein [Fimbriimonas ginsengisoli]|uniref:ROK family protein n=1 Tax=Fimbriimonas ginsengisoli TaxID=1005039 RepID=UPI00130EDBBD|nr:ROK family protein [Fimbriimonas ginsengisoli]